MNTLMDGAGGAQNRRGHSIVLLALTVLANGFWAQAQPEWERTEGPGLPSEMVLDAAGNVYVAGFAFSTNCPYAVKYAPDGTRLWAVDYGTPGGAHALAVDRSTNLYLAGAIGTNFFVAKYDDDGNEIWTSLYDHVQPPSSLFNWTEVAVDGGGNVFVTDYFTGTGVKLVKFDPNGMQLWAVILSNVVVTCSLCEPIQLSVDNAGTAYVLGRLRPDYHLKVEKYDTEGVRLWTATASSPIADTGDMTLDRSNNVIVTGLTSDGIVTSKLDPGGTLVWLVAYVPTIQSPGRPPKLALASNGDILVGGGGFNRVSAEHALMRYDSSGRELWMAHYDPGQNDDERFSAISIDADGNVYGTGNYATAKFDSAGNFQGATPHDARERTVGAAAHGQGNVFVCVEPPRPDDVWKTSKYSQPEVPSGFPRILSPPKSQSLPQGSDVRLTVEAAGAGPLSYQWLNYRAPIPDATNTSYLVVNVVEGGGQGEYSVMVSNAVGFTVSPTARIHIGARLVSPEILPGGTFRAFIGDVTWGTSAVEASEDFLNWTTITNAPPGVNGPREFWDPGATNRVRRFYRVKRLI